MNRASPLSRADTCHEYILLIPTEDLNQLKDPFENLNETNFPFKVYLTRVLKPQ